jgi:hypothetical protein
MKELFFDENGFPEIKIIRNSIINDNRSPPPSLVNEEQSKIEFSKKLKINPKKFFRKEEFGSCILDNTGIYVTNKKGLSFIQSIDGKSINELLANQKNNKPQLLAFIHRLLQYNIVITYEND